jgi:hypothetical protein
MDEAGVARECITSFEGRGQKGRAEGPGATFKLKIGADVGMNGAREAESRPLVSGSFAKDGGS